jgi:hypothetical protein
MPVEDTALSLAWEWWAGIGAIMLLGGCFLSAYAWGNEKKFIRVFVWPSGFIITAVLISWIGYFIGYGHHRTCFVLLLCKLYK